VLLVAPLAFLATDSLADAGGPPIAPEVLDDPPAAVRAQDVPESRSPGMRSVVGPYVSIQVNVDGDGMNIVGDAANEPSIVVNPTNPDNIVIGWRQFDSVLSNFRQGGWAYSLDGGQSWTFPGVLEPGVFRSDPVLDADSAGNLYYQSLNNNFLVDIFRSTNGGVSWQGPVAAFGGDKNWMAIDRTGGIGDGNIYEIWQRFFSCCGSNIFSRSTNGGLSFDAPVPVPFSPFFGTLAVGPEGAVYATGCDGRFGQDFDQYVIAKSTDAKNPALAPSFSGSLLNMGGSMSFDGPPNPAGLLGQANVAIDHSQGPQRGNVYVLGSVDPSGLDPLDVHLVRSTNGGTTWSAPIRVNDDPPSFFAWQWFGAHAVAPSGRIDAIWNDTRNSSVPTLSELFYAYSYDAGDTWYGNVPVSQPFDSSVGYPEQNKLGDYYTLISDEKGAAVAYAATFNGEQDVYYLRVFPDCNENGVSDVEDIQVHTSEDRNGNQIPDECELLCDIGMSQATYTNGDTVATQFFRLANQTQSDVALEWKAWLTGVGIDPISLLNVGADGSIILPAGLDTDFGAISLFPVTPGIPRGTYGFNCRLLDPVTGETMTLDENLFDIQ
jgi:hypothetical protein